MRVEFTVAIGRHLGYIGNHIYLHSELEFVDLVVLNDTTALFSGNPPNDQVEVRIRAEPKRVQVTGKTEMGGSGSLLTEGQLANRLPESQLGILRINPAGFLVSSQGLRKPASILGLSPAAKTLVPFIELGSA